MSAVIDPDLLHHTFEVCLAEICFADVLPSEEPFDAEAWAQEDLMWGAIALGAPVNATLVLELPTEMIEEMASDAWGGQADPGEVMDFLRELMNTVAGSYLTTLTPESRCELGLPACGPGAHLKSPDWSAVYDVEDMPVRVGIHPN